MLRKAHELVAHARRDVPCPKCKLLPLVEWVLHRQARA